MKLLINMGCFARCIQIAAVITSTRWRLETQTPKSWMDKSRPTERGRAYQQLGISHIAACSPEARGHTERCPDTEQAHVQLMLACRVELIERKRDGRLNALCDFFGTRAQRCGKRVTKVKLVEQRLITNRVQILDRSSVLPADLSLHQLVDV